MHYVQIFRCEGLPSPSSNNLIAGSLVKSFGGGWGGRGERQAGMTNIIEGRSRLLPS